jgi:hypothetical protein
MPEQHPDRTPGAREAPEPEPAEHDDLDDALAATFPASDPVSAETPER